MSLFWTRSHTALNAFDAAAGSIDTGMSASGGQNNVARELEQAQTAERIDQLLLVNAAMWELLSEKAGLTEADLVTRIAEIDARDGVADGKMTSAPILCPKCQRTIFPKHQKCLYCGEPRPVESIFKSI
jgi:ribosomal protein S27AE